MFAGVFSYGLITKSINTIEPKGVIEMAEEKKITNKTELREKSEMLVKDYNEAIQNSDFNTAAKLSAEIEQVVNEYTATTRAECFDRLKAADDPMLAAIKELSFMTIRVKDTKVGDEKIPVRVIEKVEKAIDLLKLHNEVEGGIGKDKNWAAMIEKLNFLLTAQKAVELGINPKTVNDSYAMSGIARQIEMGKTPTSKTNILRTVQNIVTAMIGEEYKAVSHDVNFLYSVYSRKKRKALTVSCANHKYLRQYMMEICHRIVEGKSYDLDYRTVRK